MKALRILLIVVLLSGPAYGSDWTKEDTAWQSAFVALTVADWAQTRWMAKQDWHWDNRDHYETNIILGKYPSSTAVDIYMPVAIAAHTLIAWALPPEITIVGIKTNPRRIWQCVWIGVEAVVVHNNYAFGAKFEF